MEITIKEKTIKINFSFRADILYENVTEKSFEGKSETDWITYFYCNVLSKDTSISFDDFMDWLDDNQDQLMVFVQAYIERQKRMTLLTPKKGKGEEENKMPTGEDK